MLQVWTENNKLYTFRRNLRNWEGNLKEITRNQVDKARQMRSDYVEIDTFLVTPEKDLKTGEEYFLVLGGNTRNLADEGIKEREPIEIIEFTEESGQWFVKKDGKVWKDKKSFSNKRAAMQAYSFLHNARLSGYSKDEIANALADPELGDIDLNDVFVTVGDPISLSDWVDKVAPGALNDLAGEDMPSDLLGGSSDADEESEDIPTGDVQKPTKDGEYKEKQLVVCPDCGNKFDPSKHLA